ncbi:hypothetical protein [Mucilaginibacter psychrotolerans]|uniref:HAD family hydrolase n=1 Tax=Mucilaginibacter psychrotolerans TaxID=1524096 RepID=A0A4Y8RX47_9SPHI|nr:hypothetical protein [Mucilaginibacter psychrotolerans]TFF29748.1 hypothetical protein E2R66_27895 [Mucilaginibacter psychrotolerans]
MKISFDLDDTIIPGSKKFEVEQQTLLQRLLGMEPIRKGTVMLFKTLKQRGYTVGVYTTSHRSYSHIKLLFLLNGFPVDFVINQKQHSLKLSGSGIHCSKYPLAFNIDLHIDDSRGVEVEGQRYGFKTLIIEDQQLDWVSLVLNEVDHHAEQTKTK